MGESGLPCEPAVHGVIATGNVESCKELWQDFVRDPLVMDLIENGYQLIWSEVAPASKHMPNASSAQEHHEFFFVGFAEMWAAHAVILLPPGEKPMVVSHLGDVPKRGTAKFRLTVNMRYVNRHLEKKAFKLEGLKDLVDLALRGDHAVSYDLMSGYYHVGLHLRSRTFIGLKWEGHTSTTLCSRRSVSGNASRWPGGRRETSSGRGCGSRRRSAT